jgi:putative transposase
MSANRSKPMMPSPCIILCISGASKNTSHEWQDFLKVNNLKSSMSRRENCHDNAEAESFFNY